MALVVLRSSCFTMEVLILILGRRTNDFTGLLQLKGPFFKKVFFS